MEIFRSKVTTFTLITVLATGRIVGKEIERYQEAVTSLIGLENFYVEVKKRRPFTYLQGGMLGPLQTEDYSTRMIKYENYNKLPPPEPAIQRLPNEVSEFEDLADKNKICARIFESPFFDMREEEYVKFGPNAQNYGGNIYRAFHAEMQESGGVWMNSYHKQTVVVGTDKFDEYVFRCMTHEKESNSYTTYFISPIYQVWQEDLPTSGSIPTFMNGRFIFASNEQQELTVYARAEEIARMAKNVMQSTMVHFFHLRRYGVPEPDATENAICMLSVPDKIRLCAAVLGARSQFPDHTRFWPTEDNIEPCEKKKVVAIVELGEKYKSNFNIPRNEKIPEKVEMTYDEWMLGCKVRGHRGPLEPPAVSTYYVSLSSRANTAIVYKPTAEDLYIPYVGLRYVLLLSGSMVKERFKIVSYKPIN